MVPRMPTPRNVCLIFLCLAATLASAAEAPYTENFDAYPNGGVPPNFVETTDADWAISSNGTSESYVGSIGITGGQKSSSSVINLDNVAGQNFTFRTTFTIRSFNDFGGGAGKFVDLGFTGPGYQLVYKPVAGGSIYTNQFLLTGDRSGGGTYFPIGTKPCQVMIHGGYVGTDLYLTARVSDGIDTRSLGGLVAGSTANNTTFSYTQAVGGSSFRSASADVSYDDFSVVLETLPVKLGNLSTRVNVGTGEQIAIAGFIVTGNSPRRVAIRGLRSPSESSAFDTVLELVRPDGTQIAFNDDWKTTQQEEIRLAGLAPSSDSDSTLIATLEPGAYTAILRNKTDGTTRVGIVEVYDLTGGSGVGNISTRGFVGTGDNVMIAGVIPTGDGKAHVIVRALGPSLRAAGIDQPLEDPTLELRGPYGTVAITNDNWRETQQSEIIATSLAPPNDAEAAIVADLPPTNYTAIVRGKNDTTGVALVEVYHLN
jgi:hypothetical protein